MNLYIQTPQRTTQDLRGYGGRGGRPHFATSVWLTMWVIRKALSYSATRCTTVRVFFPPKIALKSHSHIIRGPKHCRRNTTATS